ncbi:MAG: 50S ribosomal protein L29 [bacterium]|nr:50S ribosomal protein L29 [bacterium]
MKIKELRGKPTEELKKLAGEKRARLRILRFSGAGAGVKNVHEARAVKREIARIITLLKLKV